jgi:hypothetical protein
MISKSVIVLFGCALFVGASMTFGATGEYQQTRDGKTTVWNGSPKAGESASWAGARDKDGYATGFGTITWSNADGKVYAVYYGNMVNGKFEGPVNAHTGRQTAHAYFADGNRATAWGRGPAPSKMNVPEELVAKRRKAETEQPKPREERAEAKKETVEKPVQTSETVHPSERAKKPVVAATKPKATPVETPIEERIPTPTPEPSIAPTSPPQIAEATTTPPTPEPIQSASSSLFDTTPIPTIAETSATSFAEETPQPPASEPSIERKPELVEQSSTPEAAKKSEADTSLNALVGPPSSLRSGPANSSSSGSTSPGTRGVAQLSEDDVISLADAEAREKGFTLSDYQRPKADYSAVKDKWSLFYNLKDPKSAGGELQPFSVTVEDKTKKVELRRNY